MTWWGWWTFLGIFVILVTTSIYSPKCSVWDPLWPPMNATGAVVPKLCAINIPLSVLQCTRRWTSGCPWWSRLPSLMGTVILDHMRCPEIRAVPSCLCSSFCNKMVMPVLQPERKGCRGCCYPIILGAHARVDNKNISTFHGRIVCVYTRVCICKWLCSSSECLRNKKICCIV